MYCPRLGQVVSGLELTDSSPDGIRTDLTLISIGLNFRVNQISHREETGKTNIFKNEYHVDKPDIFVEC